MFDERPLSRCQYTVFAICFLIVLLDGFDTAAIGYIAPSLMGEWHLSKQDIGPVLSAALFGVAGGALLAGPLADRFGRRIVLFASVLLFGAACLWSASAEGLRPLTSLRFLTGLGLGAAMPNAVTLTSEYCPRRRRAFLTNVMFCAFPLGAALGGFLASAMIPLWGWRSILLLGGGVPLVLALLILALLPESLCYLAVAGASPETLRRVLQRVAPDLSAGEWLAALPSDAATGGQSSVTVLFSRLHVFGTIALWVSYFMGLVIFYALINWMPALLADTHMAPGNAALVTALFPLGGVFAVFFGWLMDRGRADLILASGFALTAAAVFALGRVADSTGAMVAVLFFAGATMNASQVSLPALAAVFYPTSARSTGVAWMLGAGRFGSIAGSLLVAELVRRHFELSEIFAVLSLPGVIAAAALLLKHRACAAAEPEEGFKAATAFATTSGEE